MIRPVRRLAVTVAVAVLVTALSACSVSVTGAAVRDPAFDPSQPNPALMRPGAYPTASLGVAKPSLEAGVVLDAQRLADAVVGPWEVDPTLLAGDVGSTVAVKSADALAALLLDPAADIARAHGLINGFASARSNTVDGRRLALTNAAFRFPSPEAAAVAADEFTARLPSAPGASPTRPVEIPGHPDARAAQSTLSDGTFTVQSFTPHGVYVLDQDARAQESVDVAAGLVARALDLQVPRIDGFTPIEASQLATTNPDPTGLLARTLPALSPTVTMGVFTARAILHFQVDPLAAAKLYDAAGVADVSAVKTRVYQARDAGAASVLAQALATVFGGDKTSPGPTVDGLPAARCFAAADPRPHVDAIRCVAPADRWVITATSNKPIDATQQVAAQYLMLTAK